MPLSPAELSALVGLTALIGGLIGWLGRGVWVAANARRDIDQCVQGMAAINQRCAAQRAEIITEIKTALTDAIRLAVAEWEAGSARRDGVIEREQGVQAERVGQIEKDVQSLFDRVRDLEKRR